MKDNNEAYDYDLYISGFANRRYVVRFAVFYGLIALFALFMLLVPVIFYFGVPGYYWPPIFFYSIGIIVLACETPIFLKNLHKAFYDSKDVMGHLDDTSLSIFPSPINRGFALTHAEIKDAKIQQSDFQRRHHYGDLLIVDQDGHEHLVRYVMNPETYLDELR